MKPTGDQLRWMYRTMLVSRRFEEAIAAAYFEGKLPAFNMANGPIPGEMHLSNGQDPAPSASARIFCPATSLPRPIAHTTSPSPRALI